MSFAVKVIYTPRFGDNNDISKFKMICESGNQIDLQCKGNSKRYNISFSTNSINFDEVKLDSFSSKVLTITNSSEI